MVKIIGICGLKGSGKDTVGNIICKNDSSFVKMSFADTLKDIVSILMGWDRKLLQGDTTESREWREKADDYWSDAFGKMITPRIILQQLGTNVMRDHFLKSIWVDSLKKKIINSNNNIVITDVRFPNEIDMIKSLGGSFIRVERGELPSWFRKVESFQKDGTDNLMYPIPYYVPEINDVHESEWSWIGFDNPKVVIKNDGTLEELNNKIKEFLKM